MHFKTENLRYEWRSVKFPYIQNTDLVNDKHDTTNKFCIKPKNQIFSRIPKFAFALLLYNG